MRSERAPARQTSARMAAPVWSKPASGTDANALSVTRAGTAKPRSVRTFVQILLGRLLVVVLSVR